MISEARNGLEQTGLRLGGDVVLSRWSRRRFIRPSRCFSPSSLISDTSIRKTSDLRPLARARWIRP